MESVPISSNQYPSSSYFDTFCYSR